MHKFFVVAGAVAAYTLYQLFREDNQDDSPPSQRPHEPSRPPVPPPPAPSPPVPWPPITPPPVFQHDEQQYQQIIDTSPQDYTPVEDYADLRARARREGELMAQCLEKSQQAYECHDYARAETLLDEKKRHALEREKLNAQASAIIFRENNQNNTASRVDLHGLYMKEAIFYSKKAVKEACQRGDSEIRLIVGQGNHSEDGVPRLKPAIQDLMRTRGHRVDIDPKNPGVLLVQLCG